MNVEANDLACVFGRFVESRWLVVCSCRTGYPAREATCGLCDSRSLEKLSLLHMICLDVATGKDPAPRDLLDEAGEQALDRAQHLQRSTYEPKFCCQSQLNWFGSNSFYIRCNSLCIGSTSFCIQCKLFCIRCKLFCIQCRKIAGRRHHQWGS